MMYAKYTKNGLRLLILALFALLIVWTIADISNTRNKKQTQILSWWGYLDNSAKLQQLNKMCDTQVIVQEYMDVDELQELASADSYDIYIYPWGYHREMQQHLEEPGPDISHLTTGYHPVIKDQYALSQIPKDSVFFQHAVRAFVYDKNLVPELSNATPEDILNLYDKGNLFLMNEIKQLDWLLKKKRTGSEQDNWQDFYHRVINSLPWYKQGEKGIYFSNFAPKYVNDHLALGFVDSAEFINPNIDWSTINTAESGKKIAFGIHPTLSQVSSDVLTLKSQKASHLCIANVLGSREFLHQIAEENFYYSPFEESINSIGDEFKAFYASFYDKVDTLFWVDDTVNETLPSPGAYKIWNIIKDCHQDANCDEWVDNQELLSFW